MNKLTRQRRIFIQWMLPVCLLVISLSAVAQNEPYVVRSSVTPCVNVRTNPSTSAASIDCLVPGTEVTVIGSVPFWREIRFGNNQRGWVAKKYIEPAGTVSPDPVVAAIPPGALLTIHFVDVGQGDAIWIQTHDDGIDGNGKFEGYSIVIDGGPYMPDATNPFLPYIKSRAHQNADIEAMIITHPHRDHFYGARSIAQAFQVNHYYDPGYPSQLANYTAFRRLMEGTGSVPGRARQVHIGRDEFGTLNWGNELKVEVLYAWNGNPDGALGSGNTVENNSSVVLRIQYGDHVFLLMGDAEGKDREDDADTPQYVEEILLQTVPAKLKATLLKVGHHGSETSSTRPFIAAVDPALVIVQSGRKVYGGKYLPDASTLRRYCEHNSNVVIYRTDQGDTRHTTERGAVDNDHIVVKSNGRGQPQVEALKDGRPFAGNRCQ